MDDPRDGGDEPVDSGGPRAGLPVGEPEADGDGPGEPPHPALDPRARLLLRLSPLAGAPLAAALLVQGAPLADVVLLSAVLGVLPVLAVVQAMALEDLPIRKLPAYASSVASILVLAALCTAAGVAGMGWEGLGMTALPPGPLAAWSLGLTAAGLGILGAFRGLAGGLGLREHPFLRKLLPRTRAEKTAFLGVSLSAGVGEELVFRGYAIGALAPWFGVGWAVALSTVSFGVVHAYQGPIGFFRTAILGGVLAWGYLASGSLLPAVVAHTLLDILAGIVLAEKLMVPDRPSRV